MSTGQFRTELPSMQQASAHVFETNSEIQSLLSRYIAQMEPLSATANWQGAAQVSFQQLKQQWNDGARKINEALRDIGDRLVASRTEYDTKETASQQGFTALQGSVQ